MTKNITLRVDAALVREAKIIAAKRGTSLSAMAAEWLASLTRRETEYDKAMKQDLAFLDKPRKLGTYGKAAWTRDELHER